MNDVVSKKALQDDPSVRKDPENWVSGDEPMTAAQASYLATLCERAEKPGPPDDLTKADASKRIDALKAELDL